MDNDVLQPHELAEEGLGDIFPIPPIDVTKEANIMAITSGKPEPTANEPFVPEEDIVETLPDGRQVQIAAAGTPVPYPEALEKGLIKEGKAQGPSETKPAEGPKETKATGLADDEQPEKAEPKGKK